LAGLIPSVVYFFRHVLGIKAITKEALTKRTTDYQNWVKSYARNHGIPLEWAEKGVRKEDHVRVPILSGTLFATLST
jgi:hypothetical protein